MVDKNELEFKVGLCHSCHHETCILQFRVRGNEIMDVRTAPGAPYQNVPNQGRACAKAQGLKRFPNAPGRLNYPVKRVGERGTNTWQQISWDQALDEIADKLKGIKDTEGAEKVACIDGAHNEIWATSRFFNLFGSPNLDGIMAKICKGDVRIVNSAIYGNTIYSAYSEPPTERCRCVVLWGAKHSTSSLQRWAGEKAVKERGGKIIVIDPRGTNEIKFADIWLQLRPGTDTALGLGLINVIINEGLFDKEFVEKWTFGFDKLKKYVQNYPPKKVAEITWVPLEKIVEAARMYARNKPASIPWGTRCSHIGRNATDVERTRCILRAITGNLDVDGGDLFQRPYPGVVTVQELDLAEELSEGQMEKALGRDWIKLKSAHGWRLLSDTMIAGGLRAYPSWGTLGAAVPDIYHSILESKPYEVKALLTVGANPMLTMADTTLVYKAMKKVQLSVVMDIFMTPTTVLADYVLPGTAWMENPSIQWIEKTEAILGADRILPKYVAGKYDRWDVYDVFRGLGMRLGQDQYWPWESSEEVLDYRLERLNVTWEEFRKRPWATPIGIKEKSYEKGGFVTPTGKVELYSTIYEKLGLDPLPSYEEPPESPISTPKLTKDYPYILITGSRVREYVHSQFHQIKNCRDRHPDPLVEIHPETASKLGIHEGDWVRIETRRGSIRQRCKLFSNMHPGIVNAEYGFWYPEKPGEEPSLFGVWESNANVLTSMAREDCDSACGNWYLSAMLCKIYKEA